MTTRVLERGRVKCAQYWPEEEISEELIFAQYRITNFSVEKFNDYTITGLQITNLEVSMGCGERGDKRIGAKVKKQ